MSQERHQFQAVVKKLQDYFSDMEFENLDVESYRVELVQTAKLVLDDKASGFDLSQVFNRFSKKNLEPQVRSAVIDYITFFRDTF